VPDVYKRTARVAKPHTVFATSRGLNFAMFSVGALRAITESVVELETKLRRDGLRVNPSLTLAPESGLWLGLE